MTSPRIVALCAAAALALAGCSSAASSGAGPASTGTSGTGTPSAVIAQSSALLGRAASGAVTGPSTGIVSPSQIVSWSPALMPAPGSLVTGKKISVDVVYGIPAGFTVYAAHLIQAVGQRLGWSVRILAATSNTAQAAQAAMQAAVLEKPTAIIAAVVPGVWVGSALQAAKAAGIYTVDMHQDSTDGPGYDAYVPDAEGIQKALMAAYAVVQSKGTASTLLADAPGFSDANIPAAQAYLATCPGCSTKTTQFNPLDFTDPTLIQGDVTSTLASHPDLNYLLWPDGALPVQPVVGAIGASRSSKTQLLLNDAAPGSVQLLKAALVPMVVQAPAALLPLVAIADVNRLATGLAPIPESALRVPISYWTKNDAPAPTYQAITAAQLSAHDWLTPFDNAWHVSLKSAVLSVAS